MIHTLLHCHRQTISLVSCTGRRGSSRRILACTSGCPGLQLQWNCGLHGPGKEHSVVVVGDAWAPCLPFSVASPLRSRLPVAPGQHEALQQPITAVSVALSRRVLAATIQSRPQSHPQSQPPPPARIAQSVQPHGDSSSITTRRALGAATPRHRPVCIATVAKLPRSSSCPSGRFVYRNNLPGQRGLHNCPYRQLTSGSARIEGKASALNASEAQLPTIDLWYVISHPAGIYVQFNLLGLVHS